MDGASVKQAAAYFGVSERTIRRRIKAGQLVATRTPTSQGYEWRVHLDQDVDVPAVQVNGTAVQVDSTPSLSLEYAYPHLGDENALLRALELVEKLQRENLDLAGQVGFYQAKLQDAQEQVRLLSAPKGSEGMRISWWRRFFRTS